MLTACGGEPAAGPARSEPPVSAVPSLSALMTVDQQVVAGPTFAVSFTGRLSTTRGGYLFVKDMEGVSVALLRSDGNSEIPMGYELDPDKFGMLDDGLFGTSSTFPLPAGTARRRLRPVHRKLPAARGVRVGRGLGKLTRRGAIGTHADL